MYITFLVLQTNQYCSNEQLSILEITESVSDKDMIECNINLFSVSDKDMIECNINLFK